MKRFGWKWLLPLLQLVLVSACLVYTPHAYRRARHHHAANSVDYFFQHNPELAERISQGVNFPALVLAYPLKEYVNAIIDYNCEYTLVWISLHDMGFFAGVVVFWLWVGWKLDQSQGRSPRLTMPRALRIAGLTCGLVFAILTGAYGLQMTASQWRPERLTGVFGIVWSFGLFSYFAWRATRESWSKSARETT